jgi:hypothetical protein
MTVCGKFVKMKTGACSEVLWPSPSMTILGITRCLTESPGYFDNIPHEEDAKTGAARSLMQ